MLKTRLMFCFAFSVFLGLTGAGQESIEYLNLYDTTPEGIHALSHSDLPIAVRASGNVLGEVSSSVLKAESWLRLHVLAHFPATKITIILVSDTLLCQKDRDDNLGLLEPSLKNIYHSLTRWGLEKDIKVLAAFSPSCLHQSSALFSEDLTEKVIRPLLDFLHSTNSTYSISPPPNRSPSFHESLSSSNLDVMKKLGSFELTKVNVIVYSQQDRSMNRRLPVMGSKLVKHYPARPTPLPEISPTSFRSSIGFSVPANEAKKPHTPQYPTTSPPVDFPGDSPPPFFFPSAPQLPPSPPSRQPTKRLLFTSL